MTEIGNRSSRSKAGAKGVRIERIYTTPGVHPYDEVTWEKRDVVQQNWKTGELNEKTWCSRACVSSCSKTSASSGDAK